MAETIWKIYKITCLLNGKVYIGQTTAVGSKWNKYLGGGLHINRATNKYGRCNFVKQVLVTCTNQDDANEYECLYIELYDSINPLIGYNLKDGGARLVGYTHKKEFNDKRAIAMKGDGNHFFGKKHSQEVKDKISKFRTGMKLSKDHCESISKSITGRNNPIAKAVEAYDIITGETVIKFDCIADAVKVYGGHIDEAASGKRKRAAKMYWRYSK
jgi:group I intron endonuclease